MVSRVIDKKISINANNRDDLLVIYDDLIFIIYSYVFPQLVKKGLFILTLISLTFLLREKACIKLPKNVNFEDYFFEFAHLS